MNIKIINHFTNILNKVDNYKKNTLCFIDIEGTILKDNYCFNALDNYKYLSIFKDTLNNYNKKNLLSNNLKPIKNITSALYIGKHHKRQIIDKSINKLINKMKNKGIHVFALTSGYPSYAKYSILKKLNINIPILFASNKDKGQVLKDILLSMKSKEIKINNILVIDNHFYKLSSIYNNIYDLTQELELILCNFPDKYIEKNTFNKYWNEIFDLLIKGKYKDILSQQKKYQSQYNLENILENYKINNR